MKRESLLDRTHRLLGTSDLTYRDIARGANVGFEWLKSFASRRIGDPGVEKVQRVHDFLARRVSVSQPNRVRNRRIHKGAPQALRAHTHNE